MASGFSKTAEPVIDPPTIHESTGILSAGFR